MCAQPRPGRLSSLLRNKVFKEKGIQFSDRLQAWNSLCASRLLFHCGTWGHLSSVPRQNLSSCYHSSRRQLLTRSKQEGSRTNDGVRADAQVLPLPQLLSTRRIGLAHRILLHGPAWLHGLIQSTDDGSKGWTRALKHDLEWLFLRTRRTIYFSRPRTAFTLHILKRFKS